MYPKGGPVRNPDMCFSKYLHFPWKKKVSDRCECSLWDLDLSLKPSSPTPSHLHVAGRGLRDYGNSQASCSARFPLIFINVNGWELQKQRILQCYTFPNFHSLLCELRKQNNPGHLCPPHSNGYSHPSHCLIQEYPFKYLYCLIPTV